MARLLAGVTVLAMAFLGAAYSQDKSDNKTPTRLKGQLPQFYKRVGLSDEQVQKIYKLRADYKGKMDSLKKQLDDLKSAEKHAMESVLTADQLKRLRELRGGEKSGDKTTEKTKPPEKTKPKS